MGRIMPGGTRKIFLTAQEKRNCFRCLMPIFIEQLDGCASETICSSSFSLEVVEKMNEIANRLEEIFSRQGQVAVIDTAKDFNFQELIASLKFFRSGPLRVADPGDLTYLNHRIEQIIKSL